MCYSRAYTRDGGALASVVASEMCPGRDQGRDGTVSLTTMLTSPAANPITIWKTHRTQTEIRIVPRERITYREMPCGSNTPIVRPFPVTPPAPSGSSCDRSLPPTTPRPQGPAPKIVLGGRPLVGMIPIRGKRPRLESADFFDNLTQSVNPRDRFDCDSFLSRPHASTSSPKKNLTAIPRHVVKIDDPAFSIKLIGCRQDPANKSR